MTSVTFTVMRLVRFLRRADGRPNILNWSTTRSERRETMTPEKETELFATLNLILTLLQQQGERIARMEGRIDEQSRILAALIPSRIAAVPPAA